MLTEITKFCTSTHRRGGAGVVLQGLRRMSGKELGEAGTAEEKGDFQVYVNPAFGGEDLGSFAEEFATWAPEEESSRRFNATDVRTLLDTIQADESCMEVAASSLSMTAFRPPLWNHLPRYVPRCLHLFMSSSLPASVTPSLLSPLPPLDRFLIFSHVLSFADYRLPRIPLLRR